MSGVRRGGLVTAAWVTAVVAAVVAAAGICAYPWLPRVGQTVVNTGIGLAAVAAIVIGLRVYRPARPTAWVLFAAGVSASVLGDLAYDLIGYASGQSPDVSVADAFYLAMYPLLLAGAWVATRPRPDRACALDAAVVAGGSGLVVWETVIEPQLIGAGPITGATVLAVTYPMLDVVLIGAVVGLLLVPARSTAHVLVAASLGLMLVADTVYAELSVHDGYTAGSPVDLLWIASNVVWLVAGLHPAMRTLGVPREADSGRVSGLRLAVLTAAAAAVPLSAAFDAGRLDWWRIGAGTVLVLLVMARLVLLVRREQTRALVDPLTELANRRALVEALRAAIDTLDPRRGGLAVLCCDLDDFKLVNDTFGHRVGDRLLAAVGDRLRRHVRPTDLVARLGGDEFAILTRDITPGAAGAAAARLSAACDAPFRLDTEAGEVTVSFSVGWVHTADRAAAPTQLVEDADAALHEGKSRGRAGSNGSPRPSATAPRTGWTWKPPYARRCATASSACTTSRRSTCAPER